MANHQGGAAQGGYVGDYQQYYQFYNQQAGNQADQNSSYSGYDQSQGYPPQYLGTNPYMYQTGVNYGSYPGYPQQAAATQTTNPPNPNMWVGNLAPNVTENDLRSAFQSFGQIMNIKFIANKGCAFVHFVDTPTAISAYQSMSGYMLHGKPLKLGFGKEPANSAPANTGEREANATSNLWIGNIGPTVTEEQLRNVFGRFGTITNIRILAPKNCAFINFDNIEDAVRVKAEMQGFAIAGQNIKINYGKELKPSLLGKSSSTAGLGYNNPPKPTKVETYAQITDGKLVPTQAMAPANPAAKHIIETLVKYVVSLGQLFESKVVNNHKNDERFQFLFGGEGSEYYKWLLYQQCLKIGNIKTNFSAFGQSNSGYPQSNFSTEQINSRTLTPMEVNEFSQLLDNLVPTQVSIRMSKNWIMSRPDCVSDICSFLKSRVESPSSTFEQKLNILYLINDVLHHSLRRRQEENIDIYCPLFEPFISSMAQEAYNCGNPQEKEKVIKLIRIWSQKGIYDSNFISNIEKLLTLAGGASPTKRNREDSDYLKERDSKRQK